MEKLKTVFEIEGMINRILSERQEALGQLDGQIAEADAAMAAANDAMNRATAAGDLQAYQKAKAERTAAADAKEMYSARKETLDRKPLISEADYKKAYADICAEIASIDTETRQKLTALSDQMNAEADVLKEAVNKADSVLMRLQHDLYRDADRTRSQKTGEIIQMAHETAQISNEVFSTVAWGRAAVETGAYQKYRRG